MKLRTVFRSAMTFTTNFSAAVGAAAQATGERARLRDGMARGASRRESRKAAHVELLGHTAEQIDWKRSERERNCSFSFRHHLFETDGRLALGCSSF